METKDLTFVIDLNEVDEDVCRISMDSTVENGPRVWKKGAPLILGSTVRVHSDDDNTLYFATVTEKVSERDYRVRIDWDTCAPVLNRDWSARTAPVERIIKAQGSDTRAAAIR